MGLEDTLMSVGSGLELEPEPRASAMSTDPKKPAGCPGSEVSETGFSQGEEKAINLDHCFCLLHEPQNEE